MKISDVYVFLQVLSLEEGNIQISCGSVVSYDEQGNHYEHKDLINDMIFSNTEQVTEYIADQLNVLENIIICDA